MIKSLPLDLFVWLVGKERILTWDALRRRGWSGPGICLLCRLNSEDTTHLLVQCPFTTELWNLLLKHYALPYKWSDFSFADCFSTWIAQRSAPMSLAVFACWHLWIERNFTVFEDRPPSVRRVFHKILAATIDQDFHS